MLVGVASASVDRTAEVRAAIDESVSPSGGGKRASMGCGEDELGGVSTVGVSTYWVPGAPPLKRRNVGAASAEGGTAGAGGDGGGEDGGVGGDGLPGPLSGGPAYGTGGGTWGCV